MTLCRQAVRIILGVLTLVSILLCGVPGRAAESSAGVDAYKNGAYGKAHDLLQPLANAGNAEAQYHLGLMLRDGLGRPSNERLAIHWFRLAARQGNPNAVFALHNLSGRQWPTPPAYVAVSRWLLTQAQEGDPYAQLQLGLLYRDNGPGRAYGIPRDLAEAAGWFTLAARQGLAEAQVAVGRLYDKRTHYSPYAVGGLPAEEIDLGPQEDLAVAYKWYSLAAAQGHAEAPALRDKVAQHLAPEDMVRAVELIREARSPSGN